MAAENLAAFDQEIAATGYDVERTVSVREYACLATDSQLLLFGTDKRLVVEKEDEDAGSEEVKKTKVERERVGGAVMRVVCTPRWGYDTGDASAASFGKFMEGLKLYFWKRGALVLKGGFMP